MKFEEVKKLIDQGFYVFPLVPNGKLPAIDEWPERATNDLEIAKAMWMCPILGITQPWNVGVCTSRFGRDGLHLVCIDVDTKKHDGMAAILAWEMQGKFLPETYEQHTPSGGRHYVFWSVVPVGNSVGSIAPGVDIRGFGGQFVGAGSEIDGSSYRAISREVAAAPTWLLSLCSPSVERDVALAVHTDAAQAADRARDYLSRAAPAVEHAGANHATFALAAKVKDFGVDEMGCLDVMAEWNEKNPNPWPIEKLVEIINHAYQYGKSRPGSLAPEAEFTVIESTEATDAPAETEKPSHPVDVLNAEYAFVLAGGGHHILRETTDANGRDTIEHLKEASFHGLLVSRKMRIGEKDVPITKVWMSSPKRRTYDGFVFRPGMETPDRFYNLFRGWTVKPYDQLEAATDDERAALSDFLEHALLNVCGGDEKLYHWLMGYFAHLIQRPWEKPLVALVFKGKKGVGKNAFIDRIGHLLGSHYLVTAKRRYLESNFNSHLEKLLLFALDEAVWAGDTKVEGTLKDLITGNEHVIEHKGQEPFTVENRCRVIIMGNEEWLVPASEDERRYAVFNVGSGRKQDRSFFRRIRERMESGGYRLLLRYLQDFDISEIDVNEAPATQGLLDQKLASTSPIAQWWHASLIDEEIKGSEFGGGQWPESVSKDVLRQALRNYLRSMNMHQRFPSDPRFSRELFLVCPSAKSSKPRTDDGKRVPSFSLPTIDQARRDFEAFIGHENLEWEL